MKRRKKSSKRNAGYLYHKGRVFKRRGRGAYKQVKNPHRSKKYAKKRRKNRGGGR